MLNLFDIGFIKNLQAICNSGKHEQCLEAIIQEFESLSTNTHKMFNKEYRKANVLLSSISRLKEDRNQLYNEYDNLPTEFENEQEETRITNKRNRLLNNIDSASTQIMENCDSVIDLIEELKMFQIPDLNKHFIPISKSESPLIKEKNETFNKRENTRKKVFVSYSHIDKRSLSYIQRHFKPFKSDIDYWDDSKILPGQKWKEEIEKAISETKVAILLVSTDFLGSEFISENELPPLLNAAEKEGAVVLIIVLSPCLIEDFAQLTQFQMLNSPVKPLTKMNKHEKEDLFVNLVRRTKNILSN